MLEGLDRNGSLRRTAQRLHIHPNAVLQRLKRAERLLGIDLHAPGTCGTPPRTARQYLAGPLERRGPMMGIILFSSR
ncbi:MULTISPECIES: helix-turn-helix domain-containing protein [Streptomyces]|uniref:helix-turn-helix domain-containing protein n=1 Tax=Streptomyces TaxID=1883 RepID=UPI00333340DA